MSAAPSTPTMASDFIINLVADVRSADGRENFGERSTFRLTSPHSVEARIRGVMIAHYPCDPFLVATDLLIIELLSNSSEFYLIVLQRERGRDLIDHAVYVESDPVSHRQRVDIIRYDCAWYVVVQNRRADCIERWVRGGISALLD